MNKPTCQELFDCEEDLQQVHRHSDASWRHGTEETVVFYRESDNTYWEAFYRLSTDGETNELREGEASIIQVKPKQIMTTVYVPISEEDSGMSPAQVLAYDMLEKVKKA
jgi:hypothetical protein